MFDIAYIGHYTKDTIVYTNATRVVDGGAFNYGANVAARLGLQVAVVTRLAREDWRVVESLEKLGVTAFARETPASTCLRLIYRTANLDERIIEITSSAGAFTTDEIARVRARAFAIGASVRGEVPTEVVAAIAAKGALVVLDVQGFLRIAREGKLVADDWRDKADVLRYVSILKTDAVEAELITGEKDRRVAARKLAEFGPREVLLTHGGGVLVYHDGAIAEAPLVPRELRGRSGRGDTCTSAYVSRRLTAPPEDAVVWAAAVTSLKLEAEGPFNRTRAEVEALYNQLRAAQV
ncbi:MAG: carbohydrate kinase [Chloroflexi bacterium]|nr:carbohydrate kinase [Chloroflexota bacterium]